MMSNVVYNGDTIGNRSCFIQWEETQEPVDLQVIERDFKI